MITAAGFASPGHVFNGNYHSGSSNNVAGIEPKTLREKMRAIAKSRAEPVGFGLLLQKKIEKNISDEDRRGTKVALVVGGVFGVLGCTIGGPPGGVLFSSISGYLTKSAFTEPGSRSYDVEFVRDYVKVHPYAGEDEIWAALNKARKEDARLIKERGEIELDY